MAPNVPYAVSGVSETAENFRRALGTLLGSAGGISQPNASWTTPLRATATGTNLTITIAPGEIWVPNSLSSPKGGLYYCLNDANYSINLSTPPAPNSGDTGVPWTGWTAPSAGNSQIIDICAVVYDTDYGYSFTGMHATPWAEFWLMPVFGTAAATPSPPTVPNNALVICQFTVTSSTTVITQAMLNDFRFPAGLANLPGAVPIGGSVDYYGGPVPPGWVLHDGSLYQVAQYPALAVAFNSTGHQDGLWDAQYAANHSSTFPPTGYFAVPETRGRATINSGTGPGLSSRTFATVLGVESYQLTVTNLASHNHPDSGHAHGVNDPTHVHGVSDPKHGHSNLSPGGGATLPLAFISSSTEGLASGGHAAAGIGNASWSIGSSNTGIAVQSHSTGVTISSASANSANTGSGTAFAMFQPSVVATKLLRAY